MAWFMRFTRFLDIHMVYAQEAENSCGIACTLMTVFKINKLRPGKEALHKEKEIYDVYGKVAKETYDGSAYTYANHLASTLNKLKVGRWKAKYYGPDGVVKAALKGLGGTVQPGPHATYGPHDGPAIVLVGWTKGGAHFVVVDTIVETDGEMYATVCDPWDGNVHVTPVTKGSPMHYVGRHVPLSWDLGGSRHEYTDEIPGDANGWVVRRVW